MKFSKQNIAKLVNAGPSRGLLNSGTTEGAEKGWESRRYHGIYTQDKLAGYATPEERKAAGLDENNLTTWQTVPSHIEATVWQANPGQDIQPEYTKRFELGQMKDAQKWVKSHGAKESIDDYREYARKDDLKKQYASAVSEKRDTWVPASGGTEEPFKSHSGRRLQYMYNPGQGKHAYLDKDSDMILSDEDAAAHMGNSSSASHDKVLNTFEGHAGIPGHRGGSVAKNYGSNKPLRVTKNEIKVSYHTGMKSEEPPRHFFHHDMQGVLPNQRKSEVKTLSSTPMGGHVWVNDLYNGSNSSHVHPDDYRKLVDDAKVVPDKIFPPPSITPEIEKQARDYFKSTADSAERQMSGAHPNYKPEHNPVEVIPAEKVQYVKSSSKKMIVD